MRTIAILSVLAVAGWMLFWTTPTEGCGVRLQASFVPVHGYAPSDSPEAPTEILLPTFRRKPLVLAYRYLAGLRLSKAEMELWTKAQAASTGKGPDGWLRWRDARLAVPGTAQSGWIRTYRQYPNSFWGFSNCLDDAFRSAVARLEAHIKQFGPAHPAVAAWLRAQDTVFQNCGGEKDELPGPAAPDLPPEIRADRAYQIAAAKFYAMRYQEAEQDFRTIARDQTSPWRTLAHYLAVRCIVRNATARATPDDPAELARAEAETHRILSDGSLAEIHEPTKKLLAAIVTRLRPMERLLEASRAIADPARGGELYQSLEDYTLVLPRLEREQRKELEELAAKDDLTDWLLTFEGKLPEAKSRAVARWRDKATLPWLVAAVAAAQPEDPAAGELLLAADKVGPGSPAYPTLLFHSVRLLIAGERRKEARERLDAVLNAPRSPVSPSVRNALLAMRMKLAQNYTEFLRYAPRLRTGTYDGSYFEDQAKTREWLFDADAGDVLREQVPLRLLVEAVSSPRLPVRLQREVALAAWTRAVLLDNREAAATLAKELIRLEPSLAAEAERYLRSSNEVERRFNGAAIMLKFPGLSPFVRPNLLRETALSRRAALREDNWWCSPDVERDLRSDYSYVLRMIYPNETKAEARFLDAASRMEAQGEWRRLSALPAAPTYLASAVVAYARAHPEDERVPEFLHLAVVATRYRCSADGETGKYSKAAFDLLHRRYPNSPWTQKTRYWYE